MGLGDYLRLLRKNWLLVATAGILGLALAAGLSLATKPTYTSRTSVLFVVQGASTAGELAQGSTYAEKQMQSFAEVGTSPIVLQPVIDQLHLDTTPGQLAKRVTATVPQKTVIVELAVSDYNAAQSAVIANAIGDQLARSVGDLAPQTDGRSAVRATVISPAVASTTPTTPKVPQNLAIGLLLGLALGYGIALLRSHLDTTVRNDADVAMVSETPVIGSIPFDDSAKGQPFAFLSDPHKPRAEAYRRLRTNLQFLEVGEDATSLVVTSSVPGEGKTTTTLNLAMALAQAGHRVLLVDADLRRPRIAKYLGLESSVGLTTVLIGKAKLSEVVQPVDNQNLHVLAAGQIPPNPSELLGSSRMTKLLEEARGSYDVVLLDTPPLLPVTDAAVLAKLVGGAVVVIGSERVHRPQLADAFAAMETAGAKVHGVIINLIRRRNIDRYSYDYRYGSSYSSPKEMGATGSTVAKADSSRSEDVPEEALT